MQEELTDLIRRRFKADTVPGRNKVKPFDVAIREGVKPGMSIHLTATHGRPMSAVNEIVRQFHGKDPKFHVLSMGANMNQVLFVHMGLARKFSSSFLGDSYPSPGPNRVFQDAYKNNTVQFEHWSILSYPMRLMAGAMGIKFIPTKSLMGSSLEDGKEEDSYKIIDSPFGDGKIGALKAFNPDISIIHGWAADQAGNMLLTPPYGENIYGALAAKKGVIASVERIVSTEFIKKHNHLVKIPSYHVLSVSQVRYGCHPSGLSNMGIDELPAYADDYEFMIELRDACKDPKKLDEWVDEWVLSIKSQDEYVEKLGRQKLYFLEGKANEHSWEAEIEELSAEIDVNEPPNPREFMIVAGARRLIERIKAENYQTLLAGVGASNLAAWLAYKALEEELTEIDLMAEVGFYGYSPRPADPYVFNFRNMPTCKMLSSIDQIMGMFMGGEHNRCIGALGAAQVDKHGNINTTCIPERGTFITGSGGGNDIASSAAEVLIVAVGGKYRLVEELSYVTSPGKSVKFLATDRGVFEKIDGELTLTAYFPQDGMSKEEAVNKIKEDCSWDLKVSENLIEEPLPEREELLLVRIFDPKKQFTT